MKYSLLLHSLESKPSRKQLEEISVNVRSMARADCAFIVDDWFGIVASGLPLAEAETFQAGLRGIGIGTDLVADVDIPSLHHDFRCQRIDLDSSAITLTTAMNRRQVRPLVDLVFVSVGLVDRERADSTTEARSVIRWSRSEPYHAEEERSVLKIEEKRFFRIDFFFSTEPYRISLEIEKETVLFYGDRSIRTKNQLDLTVLMVDLQTLLPPERMNSCLRELSLTQVYPRMRSYEEELRWAFFRLGAKG